MKTLTNIIYPAFALFAFACFGLSPTAQALLPPPPPDGGYPNGNTAEGDGALFNLTTGLENTAVGFNALSSNLDSSANTAIGYQALSANTASANTACGHKALLSNTTGRENTAVGDHALDSNQTGFGNVAIGVDTCNINHVGSNNTAVGWGALISNNANNNTAVGSGALANSTGSNNISLGERAGLNLTTGSNNIEIGASGNAGDANTIRIGKSGTQTKTFIQGIRGATVANGVGVIVGTTGQLGTVQSSRRFKEAIKPMEKASEAILALKPVSFRYKHELDPDRIPQFGLVAEDVEKVNRDLVVRDENGDLSSVRYDAVNAMLLNEFLKEHHSVQEQEATITQLKKDFGATIAQLTARLDAQDSKIQKVSAQLAAASPSRGGLEASKFAIGRIRRGGTAPQIVLTNR